MTNASPVVSAGGGAAAAAPSRKRTAVELGDAAAAATTEPKKSKSPNASQPYFCTPAAAAETLRKYGLAIVPNVLDATEIGAMKVGAWSAMEHLCRHTATPLKQDMPSTWSSFRELLPIHSMLLQHYGIGHAPFIWDVRQNSKVVAPFADIWKCKPEELLVSYDGMSFHFPPETIGYGNYRKSWFHTDQSPLRNEFECVQSWVTAYDVNDGDATLAVLVGSHLHHRTLREGALASSNKGKSEWYALSESEIARYKDLGCTEHFVTCPAGSLVLWDSRTIHFGRESLKSRAEPNFRCIVYVCMVPRSKVTKPSIFKRRQEAFENRRMTSHWPNKCLLFAKQPRTWGRDIQLPKVDPFPEPVLTPLGRKLVGYQS